MKFTYQELQDKEGDKIGQFRGYPVYCASIHGYTHSYMGNGIALIYDDNNMLVVGDKAIGRILPLLLTIIGIQKLRVSLI